jgi:xanthine dehydrogenase YagT iron-sulfur-binding subunit
MTPDGDKQNRVEDMMSDPDLDGEDLVPPSQPAASTEADGLQWTRREMVQLSAGALAALAFGTALPDTVAAELASDTETTAPVGVTLRVNGREQRLDLDPRVSLLDALREHLRLTGTKKGCDHGQCGACTVLVNGRRINSCLTLAVMHDGDEIVTIEGLGSPGALHPLQATFVEHDGFQCGYCTPGQILSAIGMLEEVKANWPSHVTPDVAARQIAFTDAEIRERMSGNICRCAAYPNIVAAIREVAGAAGTGARP